MGLQSLLAKVGRSDPASVRHLVNVLDEEGRSCLVLAARGGHVHAAALLLSNGADVTSQPPTCKAGKHGTALHEAAARCHVDLANMLLSYGANPFLANAGGVTPVEAAKLAGSARIVEAFYARARWRGELLVRWTGFFGASWKKRTVVVMDHYPFTGTPGSPPQGRTQLWIEAEGKPAEAPRARMWLDGSSTFVRDADALLCLHADHPSPPSSTHVYWRRACGRPCVFLRSANSLPGSAPFAGFLSACSTAGGPHAGGGRAPIPLPAMSVGWLDGASGSPMPPATVLPGVPPLVQASSSTGGGGHSRTTSEQILPRPSTAHTQSISYGGAGSSGGGGTPPAARARPRSAIPAPQSPAQSDAWSASLAGGRPALGRAPLPTQLGAPPLPPPQQGAWAYAHTDANSARQGESDAEFAVRLATQSSGGGDAGSSGGGHSTPRTRNAPLQPPPPFEAAPSAPPDPSLLGSWAGPPPARPAAAPATMDAAEHELSEQRLTAKLCRRTAEVAALRQEVQVNRQMIDVRRRLNAMQSDTLRDVQRPQTHAAPRLGQQSSLFGAPAAPSLGHQSPAHAALETLRFGRNSSHVGAPAAPRQASQAAAQQGQAGPSRAAAGLSLLGAHAANSAPRQAAAGARQGRAESSAWEALCNPAAGHGGHGGGTERSAAAAAPWHRWTRDSGAAAGAGRSTNDEDDDAGCCVICLEAPRAAGFLHGDTVHRCVCRGCAPNIRVGDPCPLCRLSVERVLLGVY
ncbi:hypothetical protein FOA52_002168 [Chlamydomonas sp. UWO 241]|nr:hypothetical protein FOA52_002168 [Chlamydomonas sp. UWO 241]